MRKLVLALVTALVACLCLIALPACTSEPSPSDVTKSALDAMKAQDADALAQYYSGNTDGIQEQLDALASEADGSENPDAQATAMSSLMQKIYDFDYTIGEETIEGDTATVNVSITTYDLGTAFKTAMGNYISTALGMAFAGASQEEMEAALYEGLQSELDSLTEKDYTADVNLTLTKTDNGWMLDALSDEATDALTGGLESAANEVSESLSSLEM